MPENGSDLIRDISTREETGLSCQTPSELPLSILKNCPTLGFMMSLKVGSAADGTEGGGADRRAVTGGRPS